MLRTGAYVDRYLAYTYAIHLGTTVHYIIVKLAECAIERNNIFTSPLAAQWISRHLMAILMAIAVYIMDLMVTECGDISVGNPPGNGRHISGLIWRSARHGRRYSQSSLGAAAIQGAEIRKSRLRNRRANYVFEIVAPGHLNNWRDLTYS